MSFKHPNSGPLGAATLADTCRAVLCVRCNVSGHNVTMGPPVLGLCYDYVDFIAWAATTRESIYLNEDSRPLLNWIPPIGQGNMGYMGNLIQTGTEQKYQSGDLSSVSTPRKFLACQGSQTAWGLHRLATVTGSWIAQTFYEQIL